jgi:hypothetical protein
MHSLFFSLLCFTALSAIHADATPLIVEESTVDEGFLYNDGEELEEIPWEGDSSYRFVLHG